MQTVLMVGAFVLVFATIVTSVVAGFASWGAREELDGADPDYARRLYRPDIDRIVLRQPAVRLGVLLREPGPAKAATTVQMLRWVYGAQAVAFLGFVACLLAVVLADAAAQPT